MTFGDEWRQPNQRIVGLSLLDLIPTLLVAFSIAYYYKINVVLVSFTLILLGVIVQRHGIGKTQQVFVPDWEFGTAAVFHQVLLQRPADGERDFLFGGFVVFHV